MTILGFFIKKSQTESRFFCAIIINTRDMKISCGGTIWLKYRSLDLYFNQIVLYIYIFCKLLKVIIFYISCSFVIIDVGHVAWNGHDETESRHFNNELTLTTMNLRKASNILNYTRKILIKWNVNIWNIPGCFGGVCVWGGGDITIINRSNTRQIYAKKPDFSIK